MPLKVREHLNLHYTEAYPKEAVGLILDDGTFLRLHNWSRRTDRFLVGYWRIFRKLGLKGLLHGTGISTVYHSHRLEAFPSEWDEDLIATMSPRWPHVVWMIYVPGTEYMVWETE